MVTSVFRCRPAHLKSIAGMHPGGGAVDQVGTASHATRELLAIATKQVTGILIRLESSRRIILIAA